MRPEQVCVWGGAAHSVGAGSLESIFRNDVQLEVVRAGLVGLKGEWSVGKDNGDHDCRLEVERLQVDNQLEDAAHPVVLCIAPSASSSSYDVPALSASFVSTHDFLHIRRCSLHLQPLTLNVDWMFVSQVIKAKRLSGICGHCDAASAQLISFCPGLAPPSVANLIMNSSSLGSSIINGIAIAAQQQRVMQVRFLIVLPVFGSQSGFCDVYFLVSDDRRCCAFGPVAAADVSSVFTRRRGKSAKHQQQEKWLDVTASLLGVILSAPLGGV